MVKLSVKVARTQCPIVDTTFDTLQGLVFLSSVALLQQQPKSLIPLPFSFTAPQMFFPQDISHQSTTQGTLAQPTAKSQILFTLTLENQFVFPFFLSYNHKLEVPNQNIKSCVQLKYTWFVDWSERNDHSHHCGLPALPVMHFCFFFGLLEKVTFQLYCSIRWRTAKGSDTTSHTRSCIGAYDK